MPQSKLLIPHLFPRISIAGRRRGVTALLGLLLLLLSACHYSSPDLQNPELEKAERDSLTCLYRRHYTFGTNLELYADSFRLTCLPFKDRFVRLERGDRVVVAEVAVHPADSIDTQWVKLAASEEEQGWIRECEMKRYFVPADSISGFIYLFSRTHASGFLLVCTLFLAAWLFRLQRHKPLLLVGVNDIDSVYPLLLCLLMAVNATLYESMQTFVPDTWEHFYFNPTLSPLAVPPVLALFLLGVWAFFVVLLAALEVIFRLLAPSAAIYYTLGLTVVCIACYFFFILTTPIYIGYLFLLAFILYFCHRFRRTVSITPYRCGHCNASLRKLGKCPHCGAENC